MQPDPHHVNSDDLNFYRYTRNNPINLLDTFGLDSQRGNRNIRVTGVAFHVEDIQEALRIAEKNKMSKEHLKVLRGALKVAKREKRFRPPSGGGSVALIGGISILCTLVEAEAAGRNTEQIREIREALDSLAAYKEVGDYANSLAEAAAISQGLREVFPGLPVSAASDIANRLVR